MRRAKHIFTTQTKHSWQHVIFCSEKCRNSRALRLFDFYGFQLCAYFTSFLQMGNFCKHIVCRAVHINEFEKYNFSCWHYPRTHYMTVRVQVKVLNCRNHNFHLHKVWNKFQMSTANVNHTENWNNHINQVNQVWDLSRRYTSGIHMRS